MNVFSNQEAKRRIFGRETEEVRPKDSKSDIDCHCTALLYNTSIDLYNTSIIWHPSLHSKKAIRQPIL